MLRYVDKRVTAKPCDPEPAIVCTTNRTANEQGWKDIQFVSTAAVVMIMLAVVNYLCNIYIYIYIYIKLT